MAYRLGQGSATRRWMALVIVILLNVGAFVGLNKGLQRGISDIFDTEVVATNEAPPPEDEEEPPPPPPELDQPPPFVPPPEFDIAATAPSENAIADVTTVATPDTGPKSSRINKPKYPDSSLENCEEGTVTLNLYIEADGKVSDVQITKSSGYPALDNAATSAARGWRFTPAKAGGQSVATWYKVNVTFRLEDELGRRQVEECRRSR